MNELSSPGLVQLFQLHLRTKRPPEVIATAFLDTFTGLSGRIVLEALFDAWCMTQMADARAMGKHDAFLEIVDMMAQGHTYRQKGEGWLDDRAS